MLQSWFNSFFRLFNFRQQQQQRSPKRTLFVLCTILLIAITSDWIANDFSKNIIPPLIPYSAKTLDITNSPFFSPFAEQKTSSLYYRHWLGTDEIGRDVAAGIIAGTRTALLIGVGGVLLALFIGLPIGLAAGYYGDNRLEMNLLGLILRGVMSFVLLFYLYVFLNLHESFSAILIKVLGMGFVSECVITLLEKNVFNKFKIITTKIIVPLDLIVMRFVEVMQSIPFILWILGVLTIVKTLSIFSLILLIGTTSWVGFTRLVRGEMIQIRQLEYMEAAEVIGNSPLRIIIRHALPNIITPVLIAFSFGIANGVLLEAFLSFIGVGLAAEEVTWGTLLLSIQKDFGNWWLAIFPGIALSVTVYTFNRLGEILTNSNKIFR